jgi:hypothetical protein
MQGQNLSNRTVASARVLSTLVNEQNMTASAVLSVRVLLPSNSCALCSFCKEHQLYGKPLLAAKLLE